MKITLESTAEIVEINGQPCRVWEGATAKGVRVTAFITRLAVPADQDLGEFDRELKETPPLTASAAWPRRML